MIRAFMWYVSQRSLESVGQWILHSVTVVSVRTCSIDADPSDTARTPKA